MEEVIENPEILASIIFDFIEEDEGHVKKRRQRYARSSDLWETTWGKLYNNPLTRDPRSFYGKKFRSRFRVPYLFFVDILLPLCKEHDVFDVRKSSRTPIEFKIMIALRTLGRGLVADDCSEMSEVGQSTCNVIVKTFVLQFAKKLGPLFVRKPTEQQLRNITALYGHLGFHGCVGSTDTTHVRWDRCPNMLRHDYIGKENYPCLRYLLVVDHRLYIYHCSDGYAGGNNDKKISRLDEFIQAMLEGMYSDLEYFLYDEDGTPILCEGGYLICDGGFLKCSIFMDPMHDRFCYYEVLYSEWEESIRKDVERVNGILKGRFRILKMPILYGNPKVIDAIFMTCCILHNMLLTYDDIHKGGSLERCERFWEDMVPENEDPVINEDAVNLELIDVLRSENMERPVDILPRRELLPTYKKGYVFKLADYHLKRNSLLTSFSRQWEFGKISWPRNFSSFQKLMMTCERRTARELGRAVLYTKPSTIELIEARHGDNSRGIGDGLFSNLLWKKNDVIVVFKGEIIDMHERDKRIEEGKHGYMIEFNRNSYLDCYENRWANGDDRCLASVANCPRNCRFVDVRMRGNPSPNARLRLDLVNKKAALVSIKQIAAHEEILWDYGSAFRNYSACNKLKSIIDR